MAIKLMENFAGLTIYIPSITQNTSGRMLKGFSIFRRELFRK
ncbi:MAG: hypothetical protein ABRQ37_26240 [Candidatus Eremiobacterota bacterium]